MSNYQTIYRKVNRNYEVEYGIINWEELTGLIFDRPFVVINYVDLEKGKPPPSANPTWLRKEIWDDLTSSFIFNDNNWWDEPAVSL